MAVVVRIATDGRGRAPAAAARSRATRRRPRDARSDRPPRFDGSRPVREVTQSVVDDVSREFEITLVSMYLPDRDGRLSMVGVAGYHSPFHVIDIGVGVIGRAAATHQTQFVPDVLADPDYRAARDDVRSEIAAPIVHDGELLGVVNFEGTLAQPMATVARGPGRAASRGRSPPRCARPASTRSDASDCTPSSASSEVSRGLVGDLDRSRTSRAVVDAAADLLGAEPSLIAGRGADGVVPRRGTRLPPRRSDGRPSPWTRATRRRAAKRSRLGERVDPAGARPVERARRPAPCWRSRSGSTADVAAVLVATRPSGAAAVRRRSSAASRTCWSTQVAVALRNADRHAQVSDAAVRDPLTGLLNRRYFDEAVETAFATARRRRTPLSLIVLDLDRFSAVNNEHGHAVGDAVLRRVARGDGGRRPGRRHRPRVTAARSSWSSPRARTPTGRRRRRADPCRGGRDAAPTPYRSMADRVAVTISAGVAVAARRRAGRPRPASGPPTRRCWPRSARAATGCVARLASSLVDDGVALLAQELGDVVHRQAGLAGRAAPLPATERLDARPRAGRRAGAAVDVQDAGLDAVEEALDLGRVLAVDAGRQAVDGVVGERQRLVERVDRMDRGERREQLVAEQPVRRRAGRRRPSARRRSRARGRRRSGARRR